MIAEISRTPRNFRSVVKLHHGEQVLNLKKMSASGTSTSDRWSLVLSDGRHYSRSMLATQQNGTIESGDLQEGCLIRLTDFIVNAVHNKK